MKDLDCSEFAATVDRAFFGYDMPESESINAQRLARLLDAELEAVRKVSFDEDRQEEMRKFCAYGLEALMHVYAMRPKNLAIVAYAMGKLENI